MKSLLAINRFFVFVCLITAIVACQGTLPNTTTIALTTPETEIAEPSLQATNTLASASSTPDLKPIVISEGSSPSFIVSKGSPPQEPGTYLIYEDRQYGGKIKYISLDGFIGGDFLQYINISEDNVWSPSLSMTSDYESPRLIFMDGHDREANFWIMDTNGNELKSLHVELGADAEANCSVPSFSSQGHWLLALCHYDATGYAYFFNVKSMEERIVPLNVGCSTNYNNRPASGFPEPEDKTWWSIKCNEPSIYCFISSEYDKAVCRNIDEPPISTSPDGSKVVVLKNERLYNSDKTVSGIRIGIVDRECLLEKIPCEQGLEFDLPYYKPISDPDLRGPWFSFNWDPTGQTLAWQNAPIASIETAAGIVQAPSTSGWIDLNRNINQITWTHLSMFTQLLGRSPDGKWLLFYYPQGLYLGSIESRIIRRLVVSDYGASFYGWLIVQ